MAERVIRDMMKLNPLPPGCSPRRIASAIASSSRPGLSRPARSETVEAS
jgi:hypothetical protein